MLMRIFGWCYLSSTFEWAALHHLIRSLVLSLCAAYFTRMVSLALLPWSGLHSGTVSSSLAYYSLIAQQLYALSHLMQCARSGCFLSNNLLVLPSDWVLHLCLCDMHCGEYLLSTSLCSPTQRCFLLSYAIHCKDDISRPHRVCV